MAKKNQETLSYNAEFSELKSNIVQLQSEDTGIEKLSELVSRAKELQDYCRKRL